MVIFIKGGMARVAQIPHVSTGWESITFLRKTSGLGADKLVRRQNIVITSLQQDGLTFSQNKHSTLKIYSISCNTPSG